MASCGVMSSVDLVQVTVYWPSPPVNAKFVGTEGGVFTGIPSPREFFTKTLGHVTVFPVPSPALIRNWKNQGYNHC